MRTARLILVLIAVAAGILVGAGGAVASGGSSSGADSCPAPRVDIFDLSIPPDPVAAGTTLTQGTPEADAYLHWLDLSTAYGGVSEALVNQDPSRGGIEYLDSTIANASSGGTVLDYTPGFDTAPAGAVGGVDYVVTGSITGSEGAYVVTVSLQDATTRAQIAAGQATFSSSLDSMAAAQTAASQLTPVLGKIRAYQQKLKAQSSEMAISPPNDQPQVTPAKRSLTSGQSTGVSLSLRDCDGLALAHRTLKLTATHGRISPSSVKTDTAGRARATFTAGSRGIATIQADYGPYETVVHQRDQRRGSAAVAVKASGVWELNIDASWQETGSVTWASGVDTEDDQASLQSSVHAMELVRTRDPLTNSNAGGWNMIGGQAQASAGEAETMLQVMHIPDGQTCRTIGSFDGSTADGLPALEIEHGNPVKLDLQFAVNGIARGSFHCSPYDDNPGDNTMRDSRSFQLENVAGWHGSCSRQGTRTRGYTVLCNVHTSYRDYGLAHAAVGPLATITGHLHLTMEPL
ncbi:MAG: hypothetical protein ACRDMJ_17055 [Solirubrobacteraceae bacterium]